MNLIKNKNDKIGIWWAKISIFSILQFITFILFVVFAILTSQTFNEFGWAINIAVPSNIPDIITNEAQIIRALLVYSLVFYLFISFYIQFRLITKNKEEAFKNLWLFGLFSWVLIPYFFKKGSSNHYFKEYFTYLRSYTDDDLNLTVSHSYFLKGLKGQERKNLLFFNTLLFYFAFLVALVSFSLIMVEFPTDSLEISHLFLFTKFGYFTNTTNMLCFFILLFMLFTPKNYLFRNNTFLIVVAACITIVGLIFWGYLFPFLMEGKFITDIHGENTRTIWAHTILPITFVWFVISSFRTNLYNPIKFKTLALAGYVYPLTYGIIVFILPFFVRFTPYGLLTNPNPDMLLLGETEPSGSYYSFLFIFGFVIIFTIFFAIFYGINKIIVKKHGTTPTSVNVSNETVYSYN